MAFLSDEASEQLTNEIKKIVINGVDCANDSNNKPFLSSINELCEWLGASRPTINKLISDGLPKHKVDGKTFYNKKEIEKFLLSK